MSSVIINTSIHVPVDCDDIRVKVDKADGKKYAAMWIGNATIIINNREKALEIAGLLEQVAQELGNEDVPN